MMKSASADPQAEGTGAGPGKGPHGTVRLEEITATDHQIFCLFSFGGARFTTNYWYPEVDLSAVRIALGADGFDRLVFHIAAFEINKLCSFYPATIDFGRYRDHVTPEFWTLWTTIFRNVWAQWRYENDIPAYHAPRLAHPLAPPAAPGALAPLENRLLNFCGGGKDSLVSTGLLDALGADYDNLFYAASIYGTMESQSSLAEQVLTGFSQRRVYRQRIFEDYYEAPLTVLRNGVPLTRTAAETPSSVFAAAPIAVAAGARFLSLGHERSADTGQVLWEKTGEDVNHQWGKSLEAETLINNYLSRYIVQGLTYFSLLKPVYDIVIFSRLALHTDFVPHTNSCNIAKPWCGKCPKCAYVYVGYAAVLDPELMQATFPRNFLEDPDNLQLYRELAGLTGKLPFECIGQAGETKLMLHAIGAAGRGGPQLARLLEEIGPIDAPALIARYTDVADPSPHFPAHLADGYQAAMKTSASAARARLTELLC